MNEAALTRKIQMKASKLGARLFRNNVGVHKIGKRYVRYGVCNPGGSDLIGWNWRGRFVAIEVKIDTPTTKEQQAFLTAVIRAGGIGIIAHSTDDITFDRLT
jgi:hypothetical protein